MGPLVSRSWFAMGCATFVALLLSSDVRGADPAEVRATVEFVLEQGGSVHCRIDRRIGVLQRGKPIPEGDLEVTSVSLPGARITDEDLKRLKPLADMKTLSLVLPAVNITDAGLAHVAEVSGLTQLFLDHTRITDAGLKHLAKLKRLRTIALRRTSITDEGLKLIAGFEAPLIGLTLAETQITDAGVAQLVKMPQLNQLSLQGTAITKRGLVELQRLETLQSLDLAQCDITDADVETLTKFKKLRTLIVVDTKLTDAGIAALEKGMPTTRVMSGKRFGMSPGVVGMPGGPNFGPPGGPGFGAPRPRTAAPLVVNATGMIGSTRLTPIEEIFENVPPFLKGTMAHFNPTFMNGIDPDQGYVDVEIGKDTALYVAVTFYALESVAGRPVPQGDVANYRRMNRDGWVYVGSSDVVRKTGPNRDFFWKQFAKGDKLRLRTSMHFTPAVIVPTTPDANPLDQVPYERMTPGESRSAMKSKLERLLRLRKFDELETIVAGYRRDKAYDRHGESMLKTFYEGISPGDEAEADRAAVLKLLEDWREAKPESAAAHYALTDFWNEYAWKARRRGYDRSDEAFRLQRERYRKARETLTLAAKLTERDPYYYHLEGESVLYHGGTAEQMEKVFGESLERDPDFFFPLTAGGRYFQPRWHGGEMEQYAARCADRTKLRHGDSLYTLCAISEAEDDGLETAKGYDFDWDRLKRGFADLRKRFPNSVEYDEWNCKFAGLFEDRSETQTAFARLRRHPAGTYYVNREMEKWRLWASADFLSGDQIAAYETLKHPAIRLEWTIDDKHWIVFDDQAELAVFDAADGKLLSRVATYTAPAPRYVSVVPFSKTVVAAAQDGKVRAYKIPSGEVRELGMHEGGIRAAALSSDGGEYATLGADGRILFWDLDAKEATFPYEWDLSPLRTSSLAFIPNSRSLAVGDSDNRVGFWNRDTKKKSIDLAPRNAGIRSLRVSPDGTMLAVLAGHELTLWRLKEWELTATIPIGDYILSDDLVFSRDGKSLAGAATKRDRIDLKNGDTPIDARVILIWNAADGTLRRTLGGHKSYIRSLSFNSDGTRLVSGSDDMTIRVWKVD